VVQLQDDVRTVLERLGARIWLLCALILRRRCAFRLMLRGLVARAGFGALAAAASAGCGSARPDGLWSRAGQGVVIVEPVLQRLEHQRLSPDRWENPNSFNGPATVTFCTTVTRTPSRARTSAAVTRPIANPCRASSSWSRCWSPCAAFSASRICVSIAVSGRAFSGAVRCGYVFPLSA
jgi:hypothetical protein